nr:MAG TPA: hypothetical protein [Caudoviricetes sp.]DAS28875.1 MAG TPA: hypothetical protein [Caudoviricetes sp.]
MSNSFLLFVSFKETTNCSLVRRIKNGHLFYS